MKRKKDPPKKNSTEKLSARREEPVASNEPQTPKGAETAPTDSIMDSPAFGMWRDRTDMGDATEFVRELRKGRFAPGGSLHEFSKEVVPSKIPKVKYRPLPFGLVTLYEDRDIIVVDKPSGLLSIATDKEEFKTAYAIMTDYVRKGAAKSRNRVFIVHRLDRETSGILVFAKSEEAKRAMQDNWDAVTKQYLAVVHGRMEKDADTIESYLAESGVDKVYSTADQIKGRLSRTNYRTLKRTKAMSLLDVDLLTGRKHQIRVHLADIGHPVVGDKKYGKGPDPNKRLALHARSLAFNHPYSGKPVSFATPIPEYFTTLVGEFALDHAGKEKIEE